MTTGVVPKCRIAGANLVNLTEQYTVCGFCNADLCFFFGQIEFGSYPACLRPVSGGSPACQKGFEGRWVQRFGSPENKTRMPDSTKESRGSPSNVSHVLFLLL